MANQVLRSLILAALKHMIIAFIVILMLALMHIEALCVEKEGCRKIPFQNDYALHHTSTKDLIGSMSEI